MWTTCGGVDEEGSRARPEVAIHVQYMCMVGAVGPSLAHTDRSHPRSRASGEHAGEKCMYASMRPYEYSMR